MTKLDRKNIQDVFGLTPTQEGLLFHYLEHPGSTQYVEQLIAGVTGDLDKDVLQRCWNMVIAAHPSLRTVFRWENVASPVQAVLRQWTLSLSSHDLAHLPEQECEEELSKFLRDDRLLGFDLTDVPLRVTVVKTGRGQYSMVVTHHHIIADGWSNSIMLQELFALYRSLAAAGERAPANGVPFKEYVKWLRDYPVGRDKEFWFGYLEGVDTVTALHREEIDSFEDIPAAPEVFTFPRSLCSSIDAMSYRYHLTAATLFSATLGFLMQRYTNRRDVVFGTTLSGRSVPVNGIERMVGLLIHTVPVRINPAAGETVASTLKRIGEQLQLVEAHGRLPLVDIKACSQYQGPEELFRVLLVVENYPVQSLLGQDAGGIAIISVEANEITHYDMTVVVRELEQYELSILYNHRFYSPPLIRQFGNHFIRILESIASSPELSVDEIDMLREEERSLIMLDLNGEPENQPLSASVWEALLAAASKNPDSIALVEPRYRGHLSVTVSRFLLQATIWKRTFRNLGVMPGHIVGFVARRTVDLVAAIFGALGAGAVYLPVDPNLPSKRMLYMLRDSGINVLAGHEDVIEGIDEFSLRLFLDNKKLANNAIEGDDCEAHDVGDYLNIIYTSGSTGVPKGVMIRQPSVMNLLSCLQRMVGFTADDCLLFKTTYSFDVSISEIFGWLWGSSRLAILPSGQEKEPLSILETVARRRVTVANFVPSLFTAFCNFLEPANIRMLSSLRMVFLGGEPVLPETIQAFGKWKLNVPLINAYGPTETTIYTTLYDLGNWNGKGRISIGMPVAGAELAIVNIFGHVQPKGAPGELVISGTGLSAGYQNNPELTEQKYIDTRTIGGLASAWSLYPKLYRTGDLISFPQSGQLEFLGRMDHQVKIRGFRIELGEIEDLLLKHPAIGEAAVIVHQTAGSDKSLAAFIIPEEKIDHREIRDYLAALLPAYMVPAQFVELKHFPRTTSGKVDRKALIPPEPLDEARFTPPGNHLEKRLASIWASVLEVPEDHMDIHKDFFDFGGHSIKAITLIARIFKQFSVRLTVADVFTNPTISLMAEVIASGSESAAFTVMSVENREYYRTSSAQKRLLVLQQMEPASILYNMPVVLEIAGTLNREKVFSIFERLIERHPVLRTGFETVDHQPVQRIYPSVTLEVEDLPPGNPMNVANSFVRPFDLACPPLLRVGLASFSENRHQIILDMHHIISDGASMNILMDEFLKLYGDEDLPELQYRYVDYAEWQSGKDEDGARKEQERFWLDQFSEGLPVLELPLDMKRPLVRDWLGACLNVKWDAGVASALKNLMDGCGATGYMVFSALLNVLLAKLSGEEDIVTGGVIEGRRFQEFQPVVGMFVNTIALRHSPRGDKSFGRLVDEVKENILAAAQHGDYPFERLVEKIWNNRDPRRHPIFDVMMTFDQEGLDGKRAHGLSISPIPMPRSTAKFDLTFAARLRTEAIELEIEYSSALFIQDTVQRFAGYLETILTTVASQPGILLKDIDILDRREREHLLYLLDNTGEIGFIDKTIQQRFRDMVNFNPNRIALSLGTGSVTYGHLDMMARQTDAALRKNGISAGAIVALLMERSIEMVGAMLGVLYAGACYLPVDSQFPKGRINYMLADSAAKICITGTNGFDPSPDAGIHRLTWAAISAADATIAGDGGGSPTDPVYIIYTSGTTGKPKGVIIEQRNVARLLFCSGFQFEFSSSDIWSMFHSYCFDFSVWEMYGALLFGGKLIVIPSSVSRDTGLFLRLIKRECATVLNQTPSAFYALADHEASNRQKDLSLRYVIFGGEALNPQKLAGFHKLYPGIQLVNMFGITETTVHATFKKLDAGDIASGDSAIGGPIPTMALHIVNQYGKLAPLGVAGELVVGGAGVGRGYLNQPELTAEKFGEDPFGRGFDIYKSGDKARLLPNGDIHYLGRLDRQVQIRGFRVEMGEIQTRLLRHPAVKEAVVTDLRGPAEDIYLCAYLVWHGQPESNGKLSEYLALHLPHYMIPQFFITIGEIPLTANGKLDRKALPDPLAQPVAEEGDAPSGSLEIQLAAIWAELLGIPEESIALRSDFFQSGGHSLKAAALVSRIQKQLGIKIPLTEIFRNSSLRSMAGLLSRHKAGAHPSIPRVERQEHYRLSSAQRRLFVLHRLDPLDTSYNVPVAVELKGEVDMARVKAAWKRLLEIHEILRTSFHLAGGAPVQRVSAFEEISFDITEGSLDPGDGKTLVQHIDGLFASCIKPFDVANPPLVRISVHKLNESHFIMLLDMHHIICDGITSSVLIRQFSRLYNGEHVPVPELQYRDYAVWQSDILSGASMNLQRDYWHRQFEREVPAIDLPFDEGDAGNPHDGESVVRRLPGNLSSGVRRVAAKRNATVFMAMLGCLSIFLKKVSTQTDIVVGTPVAGRRHPELDTMPGIFINILPMRIQVNGGDSVSAHVEAVRELSLQAFANQDYPFEELVERVVTDRDTGKKPLFDVLFVAQDVDSPRLNLDGIDARLHYHRHRIPKFQLTVTIEEAEDELDIYFNFSPRRFSADGISRLIGYFENVLVAFVERPEAPVDEIDILSAAEKECLLATFSAEGDSHPPMTVVDMFEDVVRRFPHRPALMVPIPGGGPDGDVRTLTYEELNRSANRVAAILRERGIQPGNIVAIMAEPSLEMMSGILGVIRCGAAYLPIDPRNPVERTRYILSDSHAALLLITEGLDVPQTAEVQRMTLSGSSLLEGETEVESREIDPGDLLYAIYTSGTTGRSKGVLITHGNLANYVCWFREFSGLGPDDQTILTSSFAFDLGYTSIYSAMLSGCCLHLVSRETILSAESLSAYLNLHNITYIKVTPSLFSTLVESPAFDEGMLRPLKLALIGGEAIKWQDVRRAVKAYPQLRVVNHYGPTETTIGSIAIKFEAEDVEALSQRPVIGRPISNTRITIVDSALNLLPVGVAGEICISGAGVGRGYVNHPALTLEKFVENPYDNGKLMYRTGDLGRYTKDGKIEFLGRLDHQVKIRGFRVELGEIESALAVVPGVVEAAVVIDKTAAAEPLLCAYVAGADELDPLSIKRSLESRLPDYMIPPFIITLDRLPLTANGKLDRKALPAPQIAGFKSGAVAPGNEVELKLGEIWSELLGIGDVQDIDANFFHMGGHSLKAIHLASKIQAAFGVHIPLADIFSKPTIRGLAQFIGISETSQLYKIERAEERDVYPLSSAQKRMFILHQMDTQSTAYNMPAMFRISGTYDSHLIERRFETLANRHDSFRTSFRTIGGRPVQRVHERVKIELELFSGEFHSIASLFIRPFDLSDAPLLRVGLAENRLGEKALLIDMHHIAADGSSRALLMKEFTEFEADSDAPTPGLGYIDYCCWQERQLSGDSTLLTGQKEFWLETFSGELPVLDLPLDFPRPKSRSFNGGEQYFTIEKATLARLKTLAHSYGMTLYMAMMGIVTILLSKYSGQEDIVVGTVSEGRRHAELAAVVGMFVNTLALRCGPDGHKTVRSYFLEMRQRALTAFENQDYPFEELVDELGLHRDSNRNPLFDVLFVLDSANMPSATSRTLVLEPLPIERRSAKFDLAILGNETLEGLDLVFEYNFDILSASSIRRMTGCLKRVIDQALDDPDLPLADVAIIGDFEKRSVLEDFNDTKTDYPSTKTIQQLFAEIAGNGPNMPAVVYGDHTVTYGALEKRALIASAWMRKRGIEAGSAVGIMGHRDIDTIVGLLAILMTGCLYMPINPDYPPERQRLLLENGAVSHVVCPKGDRIPGWSGGYLHVDDAIDFSAETLADGADSSERGAYIMYTSGSTGTPRGVVVDHRNVVRLVKNPNYIFFTPDMRILQTGALEFDASTFEIWGALLNGLVLFLADKNSILTAAGLKDVLARHRITTIWLTSSLFNQLSQTDISVFRGLRHLLVGGEALSPPHIGRFREAHPHIDLINGYGPTENTTFSTCYRITANHADNIPIGRPIANSTAYVFDRNRNLQPVNVPGELWVGGDGVSRGYLNDPQLTAEKFVFHPLLPGQRLYRTGDLARWTEAGDIEFIGRIDKQVKIRGFRVEPAEIRQALLAMNGIEDALVMAARQHEGTLYLCAYIVAPEELPLEEVRPALEATLPSYMIPSYFIRLDSFPLTANGKVDTRSLPAPALTAETPADPPRGEIEQTLAGLWATILGIAEGSIGRNQHFFESGGHSLRATRLAADIHRTMRVNVPLAEIFARPALREMAEVIEAIGQRYDFTLKPVEDQDFYCVSAAQKRLFVLHQLNPTATAYNIPIILIVKGELDYRRLQHALDALAARHESLRTSFEMRNDEPVQIVHSSSPIVIQSMQLKTAIFLNGPCPDYDAAIEQFIEPFDLRFAPLMRVGLTARGPEEHLLLLDIHHIIADGLSLGIILRDFLGLYEGKNPEGGGFRYRDFALWQQSQYGVIANRHLPFWLEQFKEGVPVLDLPSDFQRPVIFDHKGGWLEIEIPPSEHRGIQASCQKYGVTKFMYFASLLSILLARLSGQERVVVGTPVSGRPHPAMEDIVGMFVNTLPLLLDVDGEASFASFLLKQKTMIIEAFEHQHVPFEDLVGRLDVAKDSSRNPLFDAMLSYHSEEEDYLPLLQSDELTVREYRRRNKTAKFDLTVHVSETDGKLVLTWEYYASLFSAETIGEFISYFKRILSETSSDESVKLKNIELMPIGQKNKLLYHWNQTDVTDTQKNTVYQLFQRQSHATPSAIALMENERQYSYECLMRQAEESSRVLLSLGTGRGSIVAVCGGHTARTISWILGIVNAGCAFLPIDGNYPEYRIRYILADSAVSVLVGTEDQRRKTGFHGIFLDVEKDIPEATLDSPAPIESQFSDPCYVIYTSGSTGTPKGVVVEHATIVNYLLWGAKRYLDGNLPVVFPLYTSLAFDLTVTSIFLPLITGNTIAIFDPGEAGAVVRKIVEGRHADIIKATPTHLKILSAVTEGANRLKTIIVGGEELEAHLVDETLRRLGDDVTVYNEYGPTEATVGCMIHRYDKTSARRSVPIGAPIQNARIYLLDRYKKPVPPLVVGELYIGGHVLARGYLNAPGLTAERFVPNPFMPGERLYRTGDLAKRLRDGNLEFLGRIDDQVKIRGYRIEVDEIRHHILQLDGVSDAVVVTREDSSRDLFLCAYLVLAKELDEPDVRRRLGLRLPAYMIPSSFSAIPHIPITANGKLDRRALPEPEFAGEGYMAPETKLQRDIAKIWSSILGIPVDKIGIRDNFFQMGGHSLKAVVLAAKLQEGLDMTIPLSVIFSEPTVSAIAYFAEHNRLDKTSAILPSEKRDVYPLTFAQRRLYALHQLDPEGIAYNTPAVALLSGELDIHRFQQALDLLVLRHQSLRTSFRTSSDGLPVQHVLANVRSDMTYIDVSDDETLDVNDLLNRYQLIRPFDLSRPPLLRATVLQLTAEKHLLAMDMNHMISDGVSFASMMEEFFALYENAELAPVTLHYTDYALWQQSGAGREEIKKQESFWLRQFADNVPVMELPADFARPAVRDFKGNRHRFSLEMDAAAQLKEIANAEGTTLFMVLLALYTIFLSKLTGQDDVVLGTPVAGRNRGGLETVQGMFVNTLVMRYRPSGSRFTRSYIEDVVDHTLAGFDNQEYPFEDLIEKLSVPVDTSRNPLFDVMFALQEETPPDRFCKSLSIVPQDIRSGIAKFDLTLAAVDCDDHIQFSIEYSVGLFKQDTIQRFSRYWIHLLSGAPAKLDRPISEIEMIDAEERHKIISEFNRTQTGFPAHKTIPQLFTDIVLAHPDRTALVDSGINVTYRELFERSLQLAGFLGKQGAASGGIVGLLVERGLDMMVGIMGILLAGCAYLPIDPTYPPNRVEFMLKDSDVSLVCSKPLFRHMTGDLATFIDISDAYIYTRKILETPVIPNSNSIAYIIYTSGTTGKPKGILTSHRNAVRIALCTNYISVGLHDRLLQLSNYAFDGSIFDIFGSLLNGAALVLVNENELAEIGVLGEKIRKQEITKFFVTTALFNALVDLSLWCLGDVKNILFGGERVSVDHCRRLIGDIGPDCLLHMYGPTETTVFASFYPVNAIEANQYTIPIGGPVSNTNIYILDQKRMVLPIGIVGEIYIGGHGLASGYLNRPELTHEKFVDHPFHPGEKLYRSGDLGRWLPDGSVEFRGRTDHQVKIRGFRIEPGEIEKELLLIEGVDESVVIAETNKSGEKYLIAYIVGEGTLHSDSIRRRLNDTLPHYMIPSHCVILDSLPLTANGKIDRNRLPKPGIDGAEAFVAPAEPNHREMAQLWERILGVERVGMNSHFFDAGGHSIAATRLVNAIRREFGVKVKIVDLYRQPEFGDFCRHTFSEIQSGFSDIPELPVRDYYEVSFSQKRMWVLFKKNPSETAFNLSGIIEIKNIENSAAIEWAMQTLADRHEAFRTYFEERDGEPVQVVENSRSIKIRCVDISFLSAEDRAPRMETIVRESMGRPINILEPPLHSCTLVKLDDKRFNLLVIMHHIVSDGWSMEILRDEFTQLLESAAEDRQCFLEPLVIQYKDFAAWQNRMLAADSETRDARAFWLEQLNGNIGPLELPRAAMGSDASNREAAAYRFVLDVGYLSSLNALARQNESTLFIVMIAALKIMLWQLTGQRDISVAIPAAGRQHQNVMGVIGFFVNTLILYHRLEPDMPFEAFLKKVQQDAYRVLEYQTFPLELIFGELNMPYPEISVFFNMLNIRDTAMEELKDFSSFHKDRSGDAKYDIVFYVTPYKNAIEIVIAFKKNNFTTATIEKIMQLYEKVLGSICRKPECNINEYRVSSRKRLARKKL